MASNALERHAAWDTRLLGLLRPDPERLEFATRLALICSLTTLVAETYQLPSPAFMAFFSFSLNRPDVGCLIGAAAGYAAIVFLMPNLTSIGGLMITVFIGGWAAAYVLAGGPRIGYAGVQIAIAFFMCVIQGSEPKFDLSTARDRIVGILLGNLVAYFAFVHVWPTTICRRVDPALAAAFRQLMKLVSATEPRERRLLASQAQGSLRKIEADVELAGYEPASIRSSAMWLSARRNAVETSQSLGNLLLASGDPRELSRVDVERRLDRLATELTAPSDTMDTAPSLMPPACGPQTLPARINQGLQALEETVAHGFEKTEASPHAHS